MKLGLRTPNPKKSFKARTTGKLNRSFKKSINPLYGKKGTGFIKDPGKSVYNKIYNKTTTSVFDVSGNIKENNSIETNYINKSKKQPLHYQSVEKTPKQKKIEKIFCIFLRILGIITILLGMLIRNFLMIVLGIFIGFISPYWIKYSSQKIKVYQPIDFNKKNNKINTSSEIKYINTDVKNGDTNFFKTHTNDKFVKLNNNRCFDTYIAGITKKNDEDLNIQSLLKEYVEENYDCDNFEYIDNKDILEFYDDVYQYDLNENNTIKLIYEPDNKYDPDAIKIIHDTMGHIGYIPAKSTKKVKKIIENNNVNYELSLRGGKHKFCDIDDLWNEKVITETKPYYFNLYINY